MTFAREKRILIGVLALVAPLPLPFNEPRPEGVVGFPFLLAYLGVVGYFLIRANRGEERWLQPWMLNLLGLAYIPILILDLSTLWQGQLVRAMMHLGLYALAVKLFSLTRERDKWHAVVGIFFVFLTSMATSANPFIILYLAVFTGLCLVQLTRFAFFHVAASPRPLLDARHPAGPAAPRCTRLRARDGSSAAARPLRPAWRSSRAARARA